MRDGDGLRRIVWLGFVLLLFATYALIVLTAPAPGERPPPAYEIDAEALRRVYDGLRGE